MRHRWAEEENHRAIMREAWAVETRRYETERAAEREAWAVEARRHETERASMREAWAVEARRHETEHAAKRNAWAVEARRHETKRVAMEEERRQWDRERREKEGKERQEKEEEARKRESIAWLGLEPGHCLRYSLKEYTATLSHVPLGIDGIEECWNKSVEIHGREWFPSQCEDQVRKIRMRPLLLLNRSLTFINFKGLCGRVTGHWQIDMNEPSCTPWWDYAADKVSPFWLPWLSSSSVHSGQYSILLCVYFVFLLNFLSV